MSDPYPKHGPTWSIWHPFSRVCRCGLDAWPCTVIRMLERNKAEQDTPPRYVPPLPPLRIAPFKYPADRRYGADADDTPTRDFPPEQRQPYEDSDDHAAS